MKREVAIYNLRSFRRVFSLNNMAIFLSVSALILGASTYAALTKSPFFGNDLTIVRVLLSLDLIVLLSFGTIVAHKIYAIWIKRWRNQIGSRLHVRIVSVFTMLAAAPAVLIAMFAALFFYYGVESWFSERVSTALNESQQVAQAYLKEHQQTLRADALAMANDLNRQAVRLSGDLVRLTQAISAQAYLRSLTEVIVFNGKGEILAKSGLTFSLSFEPITDDMKNRAKNGEVILIVSDNDDHVRALVSLDNFIDTYLFIGRLVEPKVLAHMESTDRAVKEYKDLKEYSSGIRVMITMIFAVVALLLLLTAVWFGLSFATTLVEPISALIFATNRIREGDWSARVKEKGGADSDDELELLGRAFNRMAGQLEAQKNELMEANHQLDLRRQFTEAVLGGVSAGIIGLDHSFCISMMNEQAIKFFNLTNANALIGQDLSVLSPEISELIQNMPHNAKFEDGQVEVKRKGEIARNILVRLSSEQLGNEVSGYVVTFDDVTDLVSAQRKAAWADVARRIAHEIKNPLTPIQLSAERLSRKYMNEIQTDPEVFQTCTDTIVRHVEDIGRMVDEFSSFARMPVPVIKKQDIRDIARQTLFLQSASRSDIKYTQDMPKDKLFVDCDGRQLAQALTNLLKNAAEAIDGRPKPLDGGLSMGKIHLSLSVEDENVVLSVSDNGRGLPVEERERLTEPYVTTRSKGTGLGLAIVKKVMEDHKGFLSLSDNDEEGATISLSWPKHQG